MKKLTLIIATVLTFGITCRSFAQQAQQSSVPHAIKYQTVARDGKGNVLSNQNVSFRISILQGSETGTIVYQESQASTTNQFGLSNLAIGTGSVLNGNFSDIDWGNGPYFVKMEFDQQGGTNYTLMGTSQLLSVPYSLYSENAGNVQNFPVKAALVATNVAGPINNPETGMLVYNTAISGNYPFDVVPGYYYNAGTPLVPNWVPLSSGGKSTSGPLPPSAPDSSNTTYGGIARDGVCGGTQGSVNTCPSGLGNTGFGSNTFGVTGSTYPSGNDNSALGYKAQNSIKTASANTAIGSYASYLMTGSGNTSLGDSALYGSTSSVNGTSNVALGYQTLSSVSTGSQNTAGGSKALGANTSGFRNVAVGVRALQTNISGSSNTAVGSAALNKNTADANTSVGDSALYSNSTGNQNAAVGYQAGGLNTTGSSNSATGYEAMYNNTTGANNTVNGSGALFTNATAIGNSAFGNVASRLIVGNGNTSVGDSALYGEVGFTDNGTYNVAVGFQSVFSISSGNYNTGTGTKSLLSNTTGTKNVATGYDALQANVSGAANTAVGTQALFSNTANDNTAVGDSAMYLNTTGTANVAEGYEALTSNTTSSYNSVVGYQAMESNVDAGSNVAVGFQTLFTQNYNNAGTTWNSYNTAVGYQALYTNNPNSNQNGAENTGIGNSALYSNTTGAWNTAEGGDALYSNTTGLWNTAVGAPALYSNKSGSHNTAIGSDALRLNVTGSCNASNGVYSLYNNTNSFNTAMGDSALVTNTTGDSNTALGYNADNGHIALGNTTCLGFNGGFYISANNVRNAVELGDNHITKIYAAVNTITISDERIKTGIQQNVPGLTFINQLKPVTYNYSVAKENELAGIANKSENPNSSEIEKIRFSGFLAQDVEDAAKKVNYDFSGVVPGKIYGLRYAEFVVPLVKAVQELNAKNEDLAKENADLKTQMDTQKSEIEELKKNVNALLKVQASIK